MGLLYLGLLVLEVTSSIEIGKGGCLYALAILVYCIGIFIFVFIRDVMMNKNIQKLVNMDVIKPFGLEQHLILGE